MSDLLSVNGINSKNITFFNKLGIYSVGDLVTYYPKRYESMIRTDMSIVSDGDRVVLEGIVEGVPTVKQLSSNLKKIMFRITDGRGIYNIVAFNLVYLVKVLKIGSKVLVIGKYDRMKNTVMASEVRIGDSASDGGIEAIYGATEGLSRKVIAKCIDNVLKSDIEIIDYIPDYLVDRYKFPNKLWAIKEIHKPSEGYNYRKAKQRIKYEEFFWYLLRVRYLKYSNISNSLDNSRKEFDENKVWEFIDNLSFELTKHQIITVKEIIKDMGSESQMNRLVQGDVGCGKTIVAFIAGYINYLAGYQTALMVPTEILAVQHHQNAIDLFKSTNMNVELITSNLSKRRRNEVIKGLREGKIDFIIGTQSLIQSDVIYKDLGLIIIDEQHRFGVNQRQMLKNKGRVPDVLSMSATPIPRTYALTIYGDMDVSSIKTKPKERKEVSTLYKNEKEMLDVLLLMKREIDLGHQIYVVVPAIDNEEGRELDNVRILEEKMNLAFGKICDIGCVYGSLDNDKKIKVMERFENGEIKILISTTVIEVGVNVPNASMIVIFQANLFGLSTLHQLRGRVGRGNIQGYCVLLSKESCNRLEILEKTSDGFLISEYDFKNRGEGDLFGVRQSGQADFKLADLKRDFDLLVRVKEDVDYFFDKFLKGDEYSKFRDYLNQDNGNIY